MKIFSWPV